MSLLVKQKERQLKERAEGPPVRQQLLAQPQAQSKSRRAGDILVGRPGVLQE